MISEIMTRDLQRIEIAKAIGYQPCPKEGCWCHWGKRGHALKNFHCPNFHEDANAQFEAWRGLSLNERSPFRTFLYYVADRENLDPLDAFNLHFCEIFLRVKNCWKD